MGAGRDARIGPRGPVRERRRHCRAAVPGADDRSAMFVPRYPPRMRPTTRDIAGIAIFVLVLLVLLVAFVAAAIPPAHP